MHLAFLVIAIIAIAMQGLILFVALFGPDLEYRVTHVPEVPMNSDEFSRLVSSLTQTEILRGNAIEVLTNSDCFYEAQLEAISKAEKSINLEAYIFHRGAIGERYITALAERARAGVPVRLTLDYIGCFSTPMSYFHELTAAGGRVKWYHSLRLDLIPQINNRTHRELMVIDGRVAFIGGAGIADHWYTGEKGKPRWRDTVLKVEGSLVPSLQAVFAQNWLRVAGEVLTGEEYFQFKGSAKDGTFQDVPGMTVSSTPAAGSTPARVLFQLLIASAKKRIYISTPYFLPDKSARLAIIKAVHERGVEVKILTPGRRSDQALTRSSSRARYGSLLKNGIEIHEYEPAMIHVKAMMVDGCWAVVGSTNFDYRSFDLNDEVNLALLNEPVTERLMADFERDLADSKRVTYDEWRKKMRFRLLSRVFSLLDREE